MEANRIRGRSSLPGTSRLLKPSTSKLFEDQRAAAKAWREKTLGIQSRGLFSPLKQVPDNNSIQEESVESTTPVEQSVESPVHTAQQVEVPHEDIVVLAREKVSEPETPPVDDSSPFGSGIVEDTQEPEASSSASSPPKPPGDMSFVTRAANLTGHSSLGTVERWFLLIIVVLSPLWLYHLDQVQVWLSENLQSTFLYKEYLMKLIEPVYQRIEVLSIYQIVAIVVGGIIMSFTLDRKPSETNAFVRRSIERLTSLLGIRSFDKTRDSTTTSRSVPSFVKVSRAFSGWFTGVIVMSYCLRIALTQTYVVVVTTLKPLMNHIYAVLALLILLLVLYRYLVHRFRTSKARKELCSQLSLLTKSILQLHSVRPYPIEYVYEEVNDALQRANRNNNSSGASAAAMRSPEPKTGPAVVLYGETGAPLDATKTSAASSGVMHSIYNMIFSPSKTSIAVSAQSDSEEQRVRRMQLAEIQILAGQILLGKTKLTSLWKDVVREVESDKRVQTVDLVVDGAQRRCWRVLSGSTAGLFGAK